jgi:3',5'-cyclic-AMP phosphodiesterase
MKVFAFIIPVLLLLFTTCNKFEYNVYETGRHEKNLELTTQYNINRLLTLLEKDTLHLVFFGDTQRFYDDTKDLVRALNKLNRLDAVFITGDLVDFGLAREYDLLNEQLKLLKVPLLTVPGNHDCLGGRTQLYESVYGPLNYAFTWNQIRFVMHNTNSREFNYNGQVPDLKWMRQQLTDSNTYKTTMFISHVSPYNEDFDPALETEYVQLIRDAKKTIFNVNGHVHGHSLSQPYNDGIWHLVTYAPVKRFYNYITIYPNSNANKKFDCISVPF